MSANATDIAGTLRTLNGLLSTVEHLLGTVATVAAQLADTLDADTAPDPCEMLSLSQVAELTGIKRRTLIDMLADGRLTGVNVGTGNRALWQIPRSDLETFIAKYHSGTLRR